MRRTAWLSVIVLVLLLLWVWAGQAAAQAPPDSADAQVGGKKISLWRMIRAGGFIGFVIILLSLVATALIIEHFLSIRRDRLVPPVLADRLGAFLDAGQHEQAQHECEQDASFLGAVVNAGLGQRGGMFGFFDMQTAMQEVSEREVSKLYRKIEYLAFIAGAAPMLGLLGTVTGMIVSFNVIAQSEGTAKPSQLAEGIWEALITTVEGLVVAIPVMFFVSFFRGRIDSFVAEAEVVVEKLMGRFRKAPAE